MPDATHKPDDIAALPRAAAPPHVVIVGGGPAGLMAAEAAIQSGVRVSLYDAKGSVGRKFLIAGKGGLNLTHSEPFERFVRRFAPHEAQIADWLRGFSADDLRCWARELGVETMIGSSGRVFPRDLKAAPLLRAWVRRLRQQGVAFHMQHRWTGWDAAGALCFVHDDTPLRVTADACVLALGGASWSVLGSDGRWVDLLAERGIGIAPLQAANVGFECAWSDHFRQHHAGAAVKPVALRVGDREHGPRRQGEFVITDYGVEGSLIYALGQSLRAEVARGSAVSAWIDLLPERSREQIAERLRQPRQGRSQSEFLRRTLGLSGVRAALLRELGEPDLMKDADTLAGLIKQLPLRLRCSRPLDEAISTAGGVRFDAMDAHGMLRQLPGVFCAGEMVEWEAPTGGYLLTASMASGRVAGSAAAAFARARAA